MYYKKIEDGFLTAIGESKALIDGCFEISREDYDNILAIVRSKPQDTEETVYKLVADTMTYEPFDAPPIEPVEEPNNDYGIPNDIYNAIIDDYTDELFEMGVL